MLNFPHSCVDSPPFQQAEGWSQMKTFAQATASPLISFLVSQGQKSAVVSWMKHCQMGVYQLPSAQKNKVKCRLLLLAGQNVHVQTELTCLVGALYLMLKSWGTLRRRASVFSTCFTLAETFFQSMGELTFSPFQKAVLPVSKAFSFIYSSHPLTVAFSKTRLGERKSTSWTASRNLVLFCGFFPPPTPPLFPRVACAASTDDYPVTSE